MQIEKTIRPIRILAIESSCDDTSVAIVEGTMDDAFPKVLALAVQSQNEIHKNYGGVVPELASREHLKNLLPCFKKTLEEANLGLKDMDVFAATGQPGLIGSLLIGHSSAKTLSFLYDKPFISCDHLEGHRLSVYLESFPRPPYLTLVVSGGHSSLYLVQKDLRAKRLGLTLDDAAGEAFDKGAKLLGLGFPGGPELEKAARLGNPNVEPFNAVKVTGLNFSFSGLKSELARRVKKDFHLYDLCASYQKAILDHLMAKLKRALEETKAREVVLVGGVASNQSLRDRLESLKSEKKLNQWYAPSPRYCTDNAAMIGVAAFLKWKQKEFSELTQDVSSTSRPRPKEMRALKFAQA